MLQRPSAENPVGAKQMHRYHCIAEAQPADAVSHVVEAQVETATKWNGGR